MNDKKATLLIIEDDLDVADMLNAYFRAQGYEVLTVNWGEDGVRACQASLPDLVILDIRLPDIDGFEVAHRLRTNRRTQNVPIIFLTDRRERSARLKGLELQADDYITKPFDVQELRLRVRNTLQRARRSAITNPITNISEGQPVAEQLQACLNRSDWAILVVALHNLEQFRELYGFVAADDLLRAVAMMLQDLLHDYDEGAFLGHLTQTNFLMVTHLENTAALRERMQKRFEQSLSYFYRDQDRAAERQEGGLRVEVGEIWPTPQEPFDLKRLTREIERLTLKVNH